MRLDAHLICLIRNNFHLVVHSSPLTFSLRMDARHRYREIAMRQNCTRELFREVDCRLSDGQVPEARKQGAAALMGQEAADRKRWEVCTAVWRHGYRSMTAPGTNSATTDKSSYHSHLRNRY